MKNETEVMASLLARLTQAKWVSSSIVSDNGVRIQWTDRGKQCMCALYAYKVDLSYLNADQQEMLTAFLFEHFPGGVEWLPPGS